MRISRSRGLFSGFLLLLLGIWGGLIAFVGPYFHYAYTPDVAWTYNTQRLWLEILPGAAVFLGGLLLIASSHRLQAMFGAWLAAAAGAWFALGTILSPLWNHGVAMGGSPVATHTSLRVGEQLGFYTGLGVVVVFLAGTAIGRLSAVPSRTVPVTTVEEPAPTEPVTTTS
ncbi:MAG: hypothetical protein ABSA93_04965 [Streptosporangiaceae bacterium]